MAGPFKAGPNRYVPVGIERMVRIYRDIDDEPMHLNNATVAEMLLEIADEIDDDLAIFVRSVAHAMQDRDEHFVIDIRQRKPGKFVSPHERADKHRERLSVHFYVDRLVSLGIKKEAAVADAASLYGRSRAWVFARLRDAEKFEADVRAIQATMNKRPSNTRKA